MSADTMEAGRAMDALVATQIMGRKVMHVSKQENGGKWGAGAGEDASVVFVMEEGGKHQRAHLPHYSTDIAAAWLVVDHFRDGPDICDIRVHVAPNRATCEIAWDSGGYVTADAPLASLAICRAALRATCGGFDPSESYDSADAAALTPSEGRTP